MLLGRGFRHRSGGKHQTLTSHTLPFLVSPFWYFSVSPNYNMEAYRVRVITDTLYLVVTYSKMLFFECCTKTSNLNRGEADKLIRYSLAMTQWQYWGIPLLTRMCYI